MIGESALEFLKENCTVNEEGNAHLTQKKYENFMAANGITHEMMEAKANADKELLNGAYLYTNEQLKSKVEAAQKDGRDATKESVSLTIGIPNGSIAMSADASKTYPVPRKPGENITKTNVVRLDIRQSRMLDKEMMMSCEEQMAKLLGL